MIPKFIRQNTRLVHATALVLLTKSGTLTGFLFFTVLDRVTTKSASQWKQMWKNFVILLMYSGSEQKKSRANTANHAQTGNAGIPFNELNIFF